MAICREHLVFLILTFIVVLDRFVVICCLQVTSDISLTLYAFKFVVKLHALDT